ncbi:MAG: class I SAM-dependent methyltransferase [Saprospiraceae bacterium]
MRQPFWKKILSYIYEFHMESIASDINGSLHVSYSQGRYQLSTQNAIYSFGDLYSNYYRAFESIDLDKYKINNVLILGFGLGSIPLMLENNFKKNYKYVGVEIDEYVIYLADKYVTNELKSPIDIISTNALTFVEICQERFDLICVDIFLDDVIPDDFQQQSFLESVKLLLTKNGIVLYNRLAQTKKDKKSSTIFFREQFLTVFPKGHYIDVEGNWMFTNIKE